MSEVPVAPAAAPAPVPAPASKPGKGLGIAGLILAIIPFTQLIGLILSIIGLVLSKRAGFGNKPAVAGIIISILFTIAIIVGFVLAGVAAAQYLTEVCSGLDAGQYQADNGVVVTCP